MGVFTFLMQEVIEFRKFLEPEHRIWALIFDAAGAFITIVSGPMFLPVLQVLLLPMNGNHINSSSDGNTISNGNTTNPKMLDYVDIGPRQILSVFAAPILIIYALRFTTSTSSSTASTPMAGASSLGAGIGRRRSASETPLADIRSPQ